MIMPRAIVTESLLGFLVDFKGSSDSAVLNMCGSIQTALTFESYNDLIAILIYFRKHFAYDYVIPLEINTCLFSRYK